jgi:hypothetical protein
MENFWCFSIDPPWGPAGLALEPPGFRSANFYVRALK